MKKLTRAGWMSILLACLGLIPVFAQTYAFQVPDETVDAYYNSDGTLSLQYIYTFQNEASAGPIDYVDLGLPNDSFNPSNVQASVNGKVITDISQADPQNLNGSSNGITLGLGANAIQPGTTGVVMVRVDGIQNIYYKYNQGETQDYASIRLTPNYFGSEYVSGKTHLRVSLHLPVGVMPDEPQWEQQTSWGGPTDPATSLDKEGRVTYTWEYGQASAAQEYEFAAAFPAKYIPTDALQTGIQISNATIGNLICWGVFILLLVIFGLVIYAGVKGAKKRKLEYLPPKIAIEGHGIKRGLTAVEAAILMEQPMDKVLTMILFGVIKKGAAAVTKRDPLELQIITPRPAGLQPYEEEFLDAYSQTNERQRQMALQEVMVSLVKSLSEKMKGFSRKETMDYYKEINERAWQQVETADTPEVKSKKYEEVMEWTMLGKDYEERTQETFRGGTVFVPMWWGAFDPGYHPVQSTAHASGSSQSLGGGGGKTTITLPSLPGADFAASVVGGVQAAAGSMVGDLTTFTSGITNKTNPAPQPSSSSSSTRSGGGRSCACACACAGCACACAGGGR